MIGLALTSGVSTAPALGRETSKIGYIDRSSGGSASVGEGGLKTSDYLADEIDAAGGVNAKKLEIVPLDNKGNPPETRIQAQKAADPGMHIAAQGLSHGDERPLARRASSANFRVCDKASSSGKVAAWEISLQRAAIVSGDRSVSSR